MCFPTARSDIQSATFKKRLVKKFDVKSPRQGRNEGGKAMRGGGSFSADELQMLRKLPAVANATKDRITYADTFKRVCVIRYLAGESPTKIFREAGLPPELIGYKRIERSVARWKKSAIKSVNGSEGMGNSEIVAQLIELFVDTMRRRRSLTTLWASPLRTLRLRRTLRMPPGLWAFLLRSADSNSRLPVGSTPKPPSASSDSRPAASTSCSAKTKTSAPNSTS